MRFCIEVVESVRAHWPAEKPLFVRFSVEDDSGWGHRPERGAGEDPEAQRRRP